MWLDSEGEKKKRTTFYVSCLAAASELTLPSDDDADDDDDETSFNGPSPSPAALLRPDDGKQGGRPDETTSRRPEAARPAGESHRVLLTPCFAKPDRTVNRQVNSVIDPLPPRLDCIALSRRLFHFACVRRTYCLLSPGLPMGMRASARCV